MQLEWDEKKRKANLAKHGVDFADLAPLFNGLTISVLDSRFDYGEFRFITLGDPQRYCYDRRTYRDG